MKILMLYSPRSGTNSVCDYFLKQNPNYTYFNQPWSIYQEGDMKKEKYPDCLKYDNVIIKSEITVFKNLNISNEKALSDFDKVLLMSRKNKREQAISYIVAESGRNFLAKNRRKYFIDSIPESDIDRVTSYLDLCEAHLDELKSLGCKKFYYEDLYYKSFDEIFEFLEIDLIKSDFDKILDVKNRYFSGEFQAKKASSII